MSVHSCPRHYQKFNAAWTSTPQVLSFHSLIYIFQKLVGKKTDKKKESSPSLPSPSSATMGTCLSSCKGDDPRQGRMPQANRSEMATVKEGDIILQAPDDRPLPIVPSKGKGPLQRHFDLHCVIKSFFGFYWSKDSQFQIFPPLPIKVVASSNLIPDMLSPLTAVNDN